MMAWKVSGLSHRPGIIASRPASMRLAMAISPSRESSSTAPISRRYMRTGSSVRSTGRFGALHLHRRGFGGGLLLPLGGAASSVCFLALHDVDAHLGEHRHDVLDLLGGDFFGRQHLVQFVVGDIAALLGELDHPLDGGIGQIEQRTVGRLRRPGSGVSRSSAASGAPAPRRRVRASALWPFRSSSLTVSRPSTAERFEFLND